MAKIYGNLNSWDRKILKNSVGKSEDTSTLARKADELLGDEFIGALQQKENKGYLDQPVINHSGYFKDQREDPEWASHEWLNRVEDNALVETVNEENGQINEHAYSTQDIGPGGDHALMPGNTAEPHDHFLEQSYQQEVFNKGSWIENDWIGNDQCYD